MNWEFIYRVGIIEAIKGVPVSLYVTFVSLLIALPLGFLCAITRFRRVPVLSELISVAVSFLRGTPLVVQIFIVYAGFPSILNYMVQTFNWNFDAFSINPYVYAFFVFSLNVTATLTEVFRSALSAVGKDQAEAARSVGLNAFQANCHIIIPQALVSAIPNICNEFLNLFKSTSLVYMMTIQDITGKLRIAASAGYNYTEAYIVIFIVYFLLGFGMEKLFQRIENNMKRYKALPQT
ncbi:MAG TPA: amino acid ABC transporter permease [Clostridia bacterium]|nr:MAG: L-cystine transport system permease protein TcyL [Firmicutes bacterium ADurb.Bin356]HOR13253.1 amino acid ABC transporter permease [Clostridia bacterium]